MFSYDTAYQQFGYDYENELLEKQGTGPTAADFIPFFTSFSLPLSAAVATFIAIMVVRKPRTLPPFMDRSRLFLRRMNPSLITDMDDPLKEPPLQVSAAFLLFPQEIEIDVNSRKRRQADICDGSSSSLCRVLQSILLSKVNIVEQRPSLCLPSQPSISS